MQIKTTINGITISDPNVEMDIAGSSALSCVMILSMVLPLLATLFYLW